MSFRREFSQSDSSLLVVGTVTVLAEWDDGSQAESIRHQRLSGGGCAVDVWCVFDMAFEQRLRVISSERRLLKDVPFKVK